MYAKIKKDSIFFYFILSEAHSLPGNHCIILGAGKGYGAMAFVAALLRLKITPQVAQKKHFAIDGRTTRQLDKQNKRLTGKCII
ncbi:hypothetical protein [Desulfosediminicola flagellatus]|uniref:hypothetical protein n=1 Tax=Desulfosediminicola flagellatus TaxID=2569541 RepID=UPI0010AD5E3C